MRCGHVYTLTSRYSMMHSAKMNVPGQVHMITVPVVALSCDDE